MLRKVAIACKSCYAYSTGVVCEPGQPRSTITNPFRESKEVRMVRAKFRVMEVTKGWRGNVTAKLQPVVKAAGDTPENRTFWSATPSGEIIVENRGIRTEMPVEGEFYYVDFIDHREESGCIVSEKTIQRNGEMSIKMSTKWGVDPSISVEMHVSNTETAKLMMDDEIWTYLVVLKRCEDQSGDV